LNIVRFVNSSNTLCIVLNFSFERVGIWVVMIVAYLNIDIL